MALKNKYQAPTLDEIVKTAKKISPYIYNTPVVLWDSPESHNRFSKKTKLFMKMELFQKTGTFKARAAINNVLALSESQKRKGVTTISAGNHAIATAYAASCFGISAKVVMLSSANPDRIKKAKEFGAEILIAEDGAAGFEMTEYISATEGRTFIHPFEGYNVTVATATCGLELHEFVKNLDVVIVPVGGGGLCSGVSSLTKLMNPSCKVYAVEPEGAQIMTKSLAAGKAQSINKVNTIADSLAPPMTTPYCFEMCQKSIDEIVLVTDDEMAAAATILFSELKLALEPAGAASTAGALGPLKDKIKDKRVGVIISGTNTDPNSYKELIDRGIKSLKNGVFNYN